jgi:hypothetical protein
VSGPQVLVRSADPWGKPIHLLHNGLVVKFSPLEAQMAHVRLGTAIAELERHTDALEHQVPQMSGKQRAFLHALLRDWGALGDARFAVLSRILGREIGSTNEMSPVDASKAIDALQVALRQRPPNDDQINEPF